MTDKALITKRGGPRTEAAAAQAGMEAQGLGLSVEAQLPHATLVSGSSRQYAKLEQEGYRVKLLPETNILEVGEYRIDVEAPPPRVPANLQVPSALKATWPHHLVQLIGPPTEEWVKSIEAHGIDVVEPISAYGLFVVGAPDQVKNLESLDFVTWVGPFKPAYRLHPNLAGRTGLIRFVSVGAYPPDDAIKAAVLGAGGLIIDESAPGTDHQGKYLRLIVEIDAKHLPALASFPTTRWLEFASPEPGLDGEREAQILAENLNAAAAPNTAPVIGYQGWLTTVGLSGTGVTVAICDTGVDTNANNNATGHLDLRGRQAAFVDYTAGARATDTDGHGTHVAGIAVGNAATAQTEAAAPNNFLWGQGVAPQAGFVAQNALFGPWPPANWGNLTQDSVNNGAQVMNNSWHDGGVAGAGYTANSRMFDQLVRDPNQATAGLDYLVIVFSAGNAGPNASTITPPKEAKNPISVGNSLTFRPGTGDVDDIRGMRQSSSRGPATDGRILPTVVAPGTDVSAALSETSARPPIPGTGVVDPTNPANRINQYTFISGTSMAAPHVSGACALLIEWWRARTGGRNPSPALLKALLINGAEDLVGGPTGRVTGAGIAIPLTNIPNNDQGWGRVSLENMLLQAPASDRGPRIFSDQRHAFTANGQEHLIRVAPVDPNRPMRITLVWTDAPGAANANPALVNDLDLEVTELTTGNVYRGNVFANGFSATGGAFDNLNNIECVYVQNATGTYEVAVVAAGLTGDARPPYGNTPWQDFALVIDNAEVPSTAPVSVVPVIDRSGSMVSYGYREMTRTSSRQFVDLLGVDDALGVVSFGSTGTVEYPPGASPALKTIVGQVDRDAAKARIDAINFTGCTYMGDGIIKARDLLAPAAGARAMVLLSDGYDNKGCQPSSSRPSAMDAVATLPANLPVYTCAMGATSDQALLEQIATTTNGRYYFMPAIDDLFEIYNYIRGQVTGTGIVANESAMASSSRVGAFVDALATEVTFSVAWADPTFAYTRNPPQKPNEVSVRLRTPKGRLLHADASDVKRIVGAGYVIFTLSEPAAGQWYVEVETAGTAHLRYTVGAFVRSPLRLVVSLLPRQFVAGMPLNISAQVFDRQRPVPSLKASARVIAPTLGLAALSTQYKTQLSAIRPVASVGQDKLPTNIGKLLALRTRFLGQSKPDLFAQTIATVPLRTLALPLTGPIGTGPVVAPLVPTNGGGSNGISQPLSPLGTDRRRAPSEAAVPAGGVFRSTGQQGSYNVEVTASGLVPGSNARFVRKELVSVLAR